MDLLWDETIKDEKKQKRYGVIGFTQIKKDLNLKSCDIYMSLTRLIRNACLSKAVTFSFIVDHQIKEKNRMCLRQLSEVQRRRKEQ